MPQEHQFYKYSFAFMNTVDEQVQTLRIDNPDCEQHIIPETQNTCRSSNPEYSVRKLRNRKKEADKIIQILKLRIKYIKQKEKSLDNQQKAKRKRSEELQRLKKSSLDFKEIKEDTKRRLQEDLYRKIDANHQLRSTMQFNKAFVQNMMIAKKQKQVQRARQMKMRLNEQRRNNSQKSNRQISEKARRVRQQRMDHSEMFFLTKMVQLRGVKERKLDLQLKIKRRNQKQLQDLKKSEENLQKMALFSEKYRKQCEYDYYQSRLKYQQFRNNRISNKKRSKSSSESVVDDDVNIFLS